MKFYSFLLNLPPALYVFVEQHLFFISCIYVDIYIYAYNIFISKGRGAGSVCAVQIHLCMHFNKKYINFLRSHYYDNKELFKCCVLDICKQIYLIICSKIKFFFILNIV